LLAPSDAAGHEAKAAVRPPPAEAAPRASVPAAPADTPAAPSPELQYFAWLIGDAPADAPADSPPDDPANRLLRAAERVRLAHLDAVIASEAQRAELVPRARAIIPQLMHSLRDDSQSAQALTARVARDPNLVVEVLRLASAAGYGNAMPVSDLTQAVGRLGTDGLRRAIARVLLKPIFDAQADPLLARTAERLWLHAEATADLCAHTATIARVEPFDAYLAGLMYNVGWTAAFRALDRSPAGAPTAMSADFIRALGPRRDRLFALLVQSWSLGESLSALAAQVLAEGADGAEGSHGAKGHEGARGSALAGSPLGKLLLSADRAAFLQLLRGAQAVA
jgi:HD-like signal output (HDOD) protein